MIALELKRNYEDDQILEWYLNQIFYGRQSYGIESAAEQFFGVPAKDLTLAQSALLAGLPQAPATYDPDFYRGHDRATEPGIRPDDRAP